MITSEIELKAMQNSDLAAYSHQSTAEPTKNVSIYQGYITKRLTNEYKIIATGNTAYRLTSQNKVIMWG